MYLIFVHPAAPAPVTYLTASGELSLNRADAAHFACERTAYRAMRALRERTGRPGIMGAV